MIFVSSRDESAHSAGRLAHLLGERLGPDEVFLADALGGGADPATAVATALRRCTAGIVVVDPTWAAGAAEPVLRQVRTLLDRGVGVLPVLVDGAAPPRADDLPEPVRVLARLRAVRLDHLTFRSDAEQVLDWLAAARDGPPAPRRRTRVRRKAPPDRPVPWWRSLWRIALWWAVFSFATVTAATAFGLLFGGDRRSVGAAVGVLVIQLLVLGGCVQVLRREIGTQQRRITRAGPDAGTSSAGRAVSRSRVRLLAGVCVTVALLLGWSMGGPP